MKGCIPMLLLMGAVAADPRLASATDAGPTDPPQSDIYVTPKEGTLAEVVVTARKRTELERDVPISIESITGAQLAQAQVTQIGDIVTRIPTVTASYATTQPFLEIRGFGTGNNQSFDQAVGKFFDNVSFGRDQDLRLPLFDIERLEVLKGPQVLLYGNSSTAGALNITTKKPGAAFEADGSVDYEFHAQEVLAQGGVTIPVSDKISFRVAGMYEDLTNGWVYNTLTQEHNPETQNYAGRVILKFLPTSDLEVLLKAEYDHVRTKGFGGEAAAQPVVGPPLFTEVNVNAITEYNNNVAPFFVTPYNSLNNQTYQADINLNVLGGTITSTTAHRILDFTNSTPGVFPLPVLNGWLDTTYTQTSEELRYSGNLGAFELTVGGFYQHEQLDEITTIQTNLPAFGAPVPPFAFDFLLNEETKSYSGFADVIYHFTHQFSLDLGARYSDITRDASQSAFPGNIVPSQTFNMGSAGVDRNPALDPLLIAFFGVPPHDYTGLHLNENFFQPQVVVQYRFSDKVQSYAKYVKGDKAGGFDANYLGTPGTLSPDNVLFKPESAEGYEIGLKGLTLNNTLDFSLAAFHTTFKDLQTNAFVGTATVSVVTNVGKARTQGLEFELHYAPVARLQISTTLAYTDAKYLDFPGAACTRAQTAAQPNGCVQDLSGTPTPFSSKFAGTLGVDYEIPLGNYLITPGGLLIGRSAYNPSVNREPLLEQQGYVQLDAHIDMRPAVGFWSVSVWGRNLTNYQYKEYGDTVPLSTQGLQTGLSRGRQVGLQGAVRF
jgi:iron complex outermembrane recepter protein